MRVAIVAESFLPNVNGVTNSVLRVIEHLRRTGHEVMVIAPDTPRGEPPADRVHDGVRVHRVPSRMFPKITSLPLGVPRPRMVGVLRGFDPDVVHLASPALLGYGGLHAARYLGVPTVAVFQTDVAGFARELRYRASTARAAWAWTRHLHTPRRPHAGPVDRCDGRPCRTSHSAGASSGDAVSTSRASPRRHATSALREQWSPEGKPIVGFVGRLAPEKHVERLAVLAARDDLQLVIVGDGVDRAKLESAHAVSGFHRCALRRSELATAYASMDVFVHPGEHETFCQAVQEAMASGVPVIAPERGRPTRSGGAHAHRTAAAGRRLRGQAARRPSITCSPSGSGIRWPPAAACSSRTWPAICDQLLGHYEAVLGTRAVKAA